MNKPGFEEAEENLDNSSTPEIVWSVFDHFHWGQFSD